MRRLQTSLLFIVATLLMLLSFSGFTATPPASSDRDASVAASLARAQAERVGLQAAQKQVAGLIVEENQRADALRQRLLELQRLQLTLMEAEPLAWTKARGDLDMPGLQRLMNKWALALAQSVKSESMDARAGQGLKDSVGKAVKVLAGFEKETSKTMTTADWNKRRERLFAVVQESHTALTSVMQTSAVFAQHLQQQSLNTATRLEGVERLIHLLQPAHPSTQQGSNP